MLRSTAPLTGKFQYASTTRRFRACSRLVLAAKGGDSYEVSQALRRLYSTHAVFVQCSANSFPVQKTEAPARKREGVESYEERKSEVDDVLTSPEANKDTELFGTEVGVADAMRFQGAAPELINSR